MQNQGSLGPTTVAELLQTMQQERATGTLSLASNGSQCSLHFLFGHLFHAVGGGADGESAVIDALGWRDGEYSFNPRAKLPPEETINSSTEDLVAVWRNGKDNHQAIAAAEVTVTVAAATTPAPSRVTAPDDDAEDEDWLDTVASGEATARATQPSEIPAYRAPAPVDSAPERAFVAPRPAAPASTPAATPRVAPTAAPWPVADATRDEAASPAIPNRPAARTAPANQAPGGVSPAVPSSTLVAGATKSQLSVLIPMPSGSSLHSGLKASFLNFPMLLRTLAQDGFSGYVSITGEKDPRNVGHILFREGAIVQAQHRSSGSYRRHRAALQEVVRGVGAGEGLIDAIELPAPLVESVGGLIVGTTLFLQLPSQIVDFEALIEFVEERPLTGAILVTTAGEQVSVVLMAEGKGKGSYSSNSPTLTEGQGVAATASAERDARIDVVGSPQGPLPAIELAEIG